MEDFELEKLDDIEDEWINQIYEKEKELDKYYKNNIYFICINYVYVDIYKNILKIKKENIKITDNFLSKENILDIIKKIIKFVEKNSKYFLFVNITFILILKILVNIILMNITVNIILLNIMKNFFKILNQ